MTIGERLVGDVVVLDIKGEMSRYKGDSSAKKRVRELLDQGHLSLLLNLTHVPYMDSSGVGEIASSFIIAVACVNDPPPSAVSLRKAVVRLESFPSGSTMVAAE